MRRRRRLVLRSAVAAAIVAAAYVWALPQFANYGSVGDRLATVSAVWGVALGVVAVLDVLSSALPWRVLLPELPWLDAIGFTQASPSLQTFVPGGAPVGV